MLAATCALGVLYFYRSNSPSSRVDPRFTWQMEQGLTVAREARPDEMVFTLGFTPEPQVQWYAKRTLFRVDDVEQAMALLRSAHRQQGILFRQEGANLTFVRVRQH
jgi:hypothetical protein